WQLCGYGRSDWSTKLIRGLTSEAAAGFRSRRGLNHDDSAPVTAHNAPFSTYKTARVHQTARRRGHNPRGHREEVMTSKAAMLRGRLVSRRSFVMTLAAAAAAPAAQAQAPAPGTSGAPAGGPK